MRLFLIILSQFLSGSIWFAGNIAYAGQGMLLSAVQLGFIIGSLGFAIFNISDRFSPVGVFLASALTGALFNFLGIYLEEAYGLLLISRLVCGICLAGIYPVGMKIAAAWYPRTLSRALGWLVGALVLATGLPHLIQWVNWQKDATLILATTSLLCSTGGVIQFFGVKDGPYLPRAGRFNFTIIKDIFTHAGFKASSFGYFGHMWELYAVFAFVPVLLHQIAGDQAVLWSFGFFAAGFLGAAAGGLLSQYLGSKKIAMAALLVSGTACLFSPFFIWLPQAVSLGIIMVWGAAVVADSPQFSALNARFAPKAYVGSALTIVNCIGFLITIVTIEITAFWVKHWGIQTAFLILALGPVFGWRSMRKIRE